nr:MAG TPA: hypothetical protein [Caudoviricetes sp.]
MLFVLLLVQQLLLMTSVSRLSPFFLRLLKA